MLKAARLLVVFSLTLAAFQATAADPLEREMREVERIRQQKFAAPVTSETISRDELPARLRGQIEKSLSYSFGEYEQMLRALYLVDEQPGDLMKSLLALLQSQVLAYYDPDTDRFFFVASEPSGLTAAVPKDLLRDSVVMHELVHALQDQRVDLARLDRDLRDDWDAALALHAVVEGEATLVMMAVMIESAGATLDDVVMNEAVMEAALSGVASTPVDSAGAPRYFVESLKFPYVEGLRFVARAYRRGGWKAVDQLLVDPPRSTRQILEPALYDAKQASPASFVPAWPASSFPDARLGDANWAFLLGGPVEGWVDDRVSIRLDRQCMPTVMVTTRWDSEKAARAFASRYETLLEAKSAAATVERRGTSVVAAYGADAVAIRNFLNAGVKQ